MESIKSIGSQTEGRKMPDRLKVPLIKDQGKDILKLYSQLLSRLRAQDIAPQALANRVNGTEHAENIARVKQNIPTNQIVYLHPESPAAARLKEVLASNKKHPARHN
jgi:hypothetical protein